MAKKSKKKTKKGLKARSSQNVGSQASDFKEKISFLAKKTPSPAKQEKKRGFQAIGRYFKDVGFELKKVVWPTRQEVIVSAIVVIVVVVILATFIGGLDFVFLKMVEFITTKL